MANISDDLADKLVAYAIDLDRYSGTVKRRVHTYLRDLEREVIKQLTDIDPAGVASAVYRERRLKLLLREIQVAVNKTYQKTSKYIDRLLYDLAEVESVAIKNLVNSTIGYNLITSGLSPTMVASIVSGVEIDGAPSSEWWSRQRVATRQRFRDQIRLGMGAGESSVEIARRVRGIEGLSSVGFDSVGAGVMALSRRDADSLVVTSLNTVSNQARLNMYKDNEDLIAGVQTLSTLDNRTTQICMSRSGFAWDNDGQPIGKTKGEFPGAPPWHWRCFVDPTVRIMTSTGYRPISKVNVGDLVLTHNRRFKPVTKLLFSDSQSEDVVTVQFVLLGGSRLLQVTATIGHPILVNGKWVSIESIRLSDRILFAQYNNDSFFDFSCEDAVVVGVHRTRIDGFVKLYNFSVRDDESYVADGVVVHNCRTTLLPILRSWEELALRASPTSETRLRQNISKSTQASMDGQVAGHLNYEQWLKTKSVKFQKSVLGVSKWKLWNSGKISFRDMIDQSGRPLTLNQLRKKYAPESVKPKSAISQPTWPKTQEEFIDKYLRPLAAKRSRSLYVSENILSDPYIPTGFFENLDKIIGVDNYEHITITSGMDGVGTVSIAATSGKHVKTVNRNIHFKRKVAYHDYFRVYPESQGSGFARNLLNNTITYYTTLGFDRVELLANIEVGGYAWARYGFKFNPANREDFYNVRTQIIDNIHGLDVFDNEHLIEIENDIYAFFESRERDLIIQKISEYTYQGEAIGKQALLGTCWDGVLYLNDLKQFYAYVNRKRKR